MVSVKVVLIASLLLASFVSQVHSRKCYGCIYNSLTGKDADCKDNPTQSKFEGTCGVTKDAGFVPFASGKLQSMAKDYQCAVVEGDFQGTKVIIRGCQYITTTCEILESQLPNISSISKIERCSLCNNDFCNSSGKAGIGIFTLISCFTFYIIFN